MNCPRLSLISVAIFLAGCTADSPTFLEPPRSAGSASPVTLDETPAAASDSGVPFVVPFLSGDPLPTAADGNLGSGCVGLPDEGQPMADGLWAAAIETRGADFTLDVVCVSADDAADPRVTNENERVRVNPRSPRLEVIEISSAGSSEKVTDVAAWLTDAPTAASYWVAINDGQVTSVERIAL